MSAPMFSLDHAPAGSWVSLKFGKANEGLSLEIDGRAARANADLMVALRRGAGVDALPFVRDNGRFAGWRFLAATNMVRKLTPCVDEFAGGGLTLRVLTPHAAIPNPKRSGNLQYATAPGLLLEITIDNTQFDEPATGFIGLAGISGLRPLDWSSKTLCGIGQSSRWILAATPARDDIYSIQSDDLQDFSPRIDPRATAGGIAFKVAPRSAKTLTAAFAAYVPGAVTQGIEAQYFYTQYFPRAEAVANFLLQNAQRIRESCTSFDTRCTAACEAGPKLDLLSRGLRAANARTQILDAQTPAGPAAYFAAIAADGRRNVLETIADRLPWDLFRNPWVVRNLFDLATATYAYHDQVRFPDDAAAAGELRDGGPTFARDFGFASAYAPRSGTPAAAQPGASAFDGAGAAPGWSGGIYATEVLLNSIYMLTGYALLADDTPWAKTRLPFARELLASLEKRDHWDPEQRTGILKAESAAAPTGEQTRFTGDAVLSHARGNLYIAVKTFCANLLLTTYFQNNNDLHSADYSYAFAQKTGKAIAAAFNPATGLLPANLLSAAATTGNPPALLAALEPLALPTSLGLTSTLEEYFPELFAALKTHAETCLKPAPEGCTDGDTLKLSSIAPATDHAATVPILFVLERLFQVDAARLAGPWRAAAENADPADPRLLSTALFLKPAP